MRDVPPRNTLDLYDRILAGGLKPLLRQWKTEEVALDEQTHRLRTEHDVQVSRETVRRWQLALAEPDQAAS